MLWKKPSKMSYCDMCIWIDKSGVIPRIADEPGKYPRDEDLVYNYLFLLCRMLTKNHARGLNFADIEPFSFFAANFYYYQLIKNWRNRGKLVKGRVKTPIVNILDYIKGTLRLRRIEYQHQFYNQVISDEIAEFQRKGFDSNNFRTQMMDQAREACFREETIKFIKMSLSPEELDKLVDKVMKTTPFRYKSLDYYNFKTSVLLNTLASLNKKNRLSNLDSNNPVIVWHLPKSLGPYVAQLTNELNNEIRNMILDWVDSTRVDDHLLNNMINTPDGKYEEESY